jgi:hypothetical protein
MLELIVTKLKDETRAPLVWITTTPIPSGACEPSMPPRSQVDVLAYNAAAAGVMAGDKRVTSCDVHETIMSQCGEGYEKCDLTYCEGPHFAEEGINLISERIQGCINEALTGSNSGGNSGGAAENSGSAGVEAESESDSESGNPENGGDEDVRKEKKSNCDHVYGQECADDAGDYASCLYCIHSNQDSFLVLGCVQHGMELVERFCGEPSAEEGEGEEGRSEEGGEEEGGEEEGGGGEEEYKYDYDNDYEENDDFVLVNYGTGEAGTGDALWQKAEQQTPKKAADAAGVDAHGADHATRDHATGPVGEPAVDLEMAKAQVSISDGDALAAPGKWVPNAVNGSSSQCSK